MILKFLDIKNRLKYNKQYIPIKNLQNGQLKLLLGEIHFFNLINIVEYCKGKDEINILYIGSGKGYHIPILINCLKSRVNNNIIWHFYDPIGHCKTLETWNSSNIKINNKLFTEKDGDYFKDKKNIIFISDIRTVNNGCSEPTTENLVHDYNLQNNILKKIKPDFSYLKCRYPFPDDFKNYSLNIPIGEEFLQPFTGLMSAELRLFVGKNILFKNVTIEDLEEYEEKMFWYNVEYRYKYNNDIKIAKFILFNMHPLLKDNISPDISNKQLLSLFYKTIEKEKK